MSTAQIWSRRERTDRWHRLWCLHLRLQMDHDPRHPGWARDGDGRNSLERYRAAAGRYRSDPDHALDWDAETDAELGVCRHDLVAALNVYNRRAGADVAHLGLTSSDIVDPVTQSQVVDSLEAIRAHAVTLAGQLRQLMRDHAQTRMVARTHGQPAQLTTWGHRQATVLAPLVTWLDRAERLRRQYPSRPPVGAVGTAADLLRVLDASGEAPETVSVATGSASEAVAGVGAPPGHAESISTAWSPADQHQLDNFGCTSCRLGNHGGCDGCGCPRCWEGWLAAKMKDAADGVLGSGAIETRPAGPEVAGRTPSRSGGSDRPASPNGGPGGDYASEEAWAAWRHVGEMLAMSLGLWDTAQASRQQYHYSQDLAVASLLAELASIAQTWATDRRLETTLGLGTEGEQIDARTVNSSAMPNKNASGNPIRCERICALAVVTRSHLSACAELAGMGWLEGDVSTSAARKLVLPAMFETVERTLVNWLAVATGWSVNRGALAIEVDRYRYQWATPIILQKMTEVGVSRTLAHDVLREAWSAVAYPDANDAFEEALVGAMLGRGLSLFTAVGPTRIWLRGVIADAIQAPVGGVVRQIEQIDRAAFLRGGVG